MSVIEHDLLTNPENAYGDFRYILFTELFGPHFQPYVDESGRPRIGAGIDLVTFMPAAASAILGGFLNTFILDRLQIVSDLPYTAGDSLLLQSRLNQVLESAGDRLTGFPTIFEFSTDSQANSVLNTALAPIERNLSFWGIPFSEERVVVATLAHQGDDISEIVYDMDVDRNRVDPWFEMRYVDRSQNEPTDDLAARHFYQSAIFELYNQPDVVGFAEAVDVGRAYTAHRATALSYEEHFDPQRLGMGNPQAGGYERISSFLQPAIAAVATYYFADVAHADELLFASVSGGTLMGDSPGDNFNNAKNDEDFIIGSSATDMALGGDAKDVILGLGGNDQLDGGIADDNLYGGEGADILTGGDGNDRLWGGGSSDILKGGSGNDIYILGGDNELDPDQGGNPDAIGNTNSDRIVEAKRAGGTDTVIAQVNGGSLNLRNVEKFKLYADVTGNFAVNLNEFHAFALSDGSDELTLVINRLQKTPINILTGKGADVIHIEFEKGVDPSQVLNGRGLTARLHFNDITEQDTIDLTSIGIKEIFTERDHINNDKGFYLLAPGVKLDVMEGKSIEKTYNNYTDHWFVVKCGDDTPYGPELIGEMNRGQFEI